MEKDFYAILQDLKVEIFFFIVFFSIVFYQFQQAELKTLVSLLLISIWAYALWMYLQYRSKEERTKDAKEIAVVDQVNEEKLTHAEIATDNFPIKGAPKKGLIYLKENRTLTEIAKDLIFVKTFDLQKYQELLIYMNQYQKVYMYILAERYPCQSYVPTFLDARENILQTLYQLYLVIPSTFKHIYGVSPYQVIERNILTFTKLSRTMLEVLENFCRVDLKEYYFPMTQPIPFDASKQKEKQNLLP